MPTYRFPILIWEDHEGYHTACLVDRDERAALARTAAEARQQLRDHLAWLDRKRFWLQEPDFLDPQLATFRVSIRPEYHIDNRPAPCPETVALAVPCVHGRQEGGLLVAALPTLGIRFYYSEGDVLRDLVVRYVQQQLQGMTPRELSRYLPPRRALLDEIVLRVTHRPPRGDRPELLLPNLSKVAEPLAERGTRRLYARAWEREPEVAAVVRKLSEEQVNVVLVGEAGSGKTTVLVQAAQVLERQAAPSPPAPLPPGERGGRGGRACIATG